MAPRRGSRRAGSGVDYVIASTPRTGSGLLAAALAGTGVAGRPDPHLRPDRAGPWRQRWNIPGEPRGTIAMLEAARASTTTPNGVFGTKLHWNQMVHVVRELRRIERTTRRAGDDGPGGRGPGDTVGAGAAPDDLALLGRHLHDPRWIHVARPDSAAQAVSYYRALYSGLWSLPAHERPRPGLRPEHPDLLQVRWLEDMLVAHERAWRDWFAGHGVTPLEITYDELDGDYPGTVARVLDSLGVSAVVAPDRPLHRQDGAWSARWLEVYRSRRDTLPPQPPGSAWAETDVLASARPGAGPFRSDRPGAAVTGRAPSAGPGPPRTPPGPRLRYSCVVDRAPMFLYQSLIWAQTLLFLAGRDPRDIVAHLVEGVPDDHAARLRSLGIEVVGIARDPRSGFANKLGQLTSGAFDDVDVVVLSDCDIAFSEDMGRLVPGGAIGAKVVDAGFPAYNVWVRLARLAGMSDRVPLARATQTGRWTSARNLNGGLLTVPRRHLPLLAEAWPRWLDWVLRHAGRFGPKVDYHAFQVSFGLTIAELDLPVVTIPTQLNFSTLPPQTEIDGDDPIALHYHRRLRPDGLIVRTGVAGTDRAIDAVNAVLRTRESKRLVGPALAAWQRSLADEAR